MTEVCADHFEHTAMSAIEQHQRAEIIRITMEWENTPYVNQGRIKGKCADCAFFAMVFEEAGLIPHLELPKYGPQAGINREGEAYLWIVLKWAKREITEAEAKEGDVVLFRFARSFGHGAVIIPPGWPNVLHADAGARYVIRAWGDNGSLRNAERRFFTFW